MWTRLIKTSNLFARLMLSLAMLIVPVLMIAPCCCVKAALAGGHEGISPGTSCCRQNSEQSSHRNNVSRCCGQSPASSSDAPHRSCCDLSRSSCECCQTEAKVARFIAPRGDSKPDLRSAETLLADFDAFGELSVKLDATDSMSALRPCPKNRTQSLLCVWRN